MNSVQSVTLSRDCNAVQIPAGNTVTLPAGTEVDITQTLGGSYTIHALGSLFRVASKDTDALGLNPEEDPSPAHGASGDAVSEEMVWETLRTCYDPEIPVNIVDLGLVYDMGIEDLPTGNKKVFVKMTLTAPGCGMGATIAGDAQQKILMLPSVEDASVEIVWDPPWHQSMITPQGRRLLGIE
ncbi:MAG: putative Fe-S cluster assembly protein SufT [Verrucomicrobiae bacterium]|nr:putative Fe-S cluster assembly protein SufT [Verrucomicrobiae bacterium]